MLVLHSRSCLQSGGESEGAMERVHRMLPGNRVMSKVVELHPLSWKEVTANPEDRCYLCKLRVYRQFLEEAEEWGSHTLADGTNSDDLKDRRPGLRAIHELGVKTPLVEAGFAKEEVRRLSRMLGLETWNKPSSSCLATRIPSGMEITERRIQQINRLEEFLHSLGFDGCRVRLDKEDESTVFVQLQHVDIDKIVGKPLRVTLIHFFNKSGIRKVFLDLDGR